MTELAFHFYKTKKSELSPSDFSSFMNLYTEKYNLPIKEEVLLKNLSLIVSRDSFNNYLFRYPYIYYFFVAKYLVENIESEEIKKEIEKIINNLHIDENAYIAIFMTHHSRNVNILDEIELNAMVLFEKYLPATLVKDEVKFFDEHVNKIIKISLPPPTTPPEKVRTEILKMQDEIEKSQEDLKEDESEDDLSVKDLRKAVRTVEVIGCIIKNRAGSIEKTKLKEMFIEAMNVHLRILSLFFDLIKNEIEKIGENH